MSLAKIGAISGEAFAKSLKAQKRLGIAATAGAGTAAAGSLAAAAAAQSAKEKDTDYRKDIYVTNRGRPGDDASMQSAQMLGAIMAANRGSGGQSASTTQVADTTSTTWSDKMPWIIGGVCVAFIILVLVFNKKGGRRR